MKRWVGISMVYIWKEHFREVKVQRAERGHWGQAWWSSPRMKSRESAHAPMVVHIRDWVSLQWEAQKRLSGGRQAQCYFRMIFLVDAWRRDRDKNVAPAGWIGWGDRRLEPRPVSREQDSISIPAAGADQQVPSGLFPGWKASPAQYRSVQLHPLYRINFLRRWNENTFWVNVF